VGQPSAFQPDSERRRSWAEVDLGALQRNLRWLRDRAPGRRAIAVVKANAYGHGATRVAQSLLAAGAEMLAVATAAEAAELRAQRIESPLLILEGLDAPEGADRIVAERLTPVVARLDQLAPLEAAADRSGRVLPVHLKFDTGMHRLGFDWQRAGELLERVAASAALRIDGLMSHLACADELDSAQTARQRERFAAVLAVARERGVEPPWIHIDNSAGVIHGPTAATTAIRPGLALYGADPTLERATRLEPAMALRTRVVGAVDLPAGSHVGYGGAFVTTRKTRVLTLPLGYADGLPRAAGGHAELGLAGRRVPVVGRVSMDLSAVDAGDASETAVGDEVLVFGRSNGFELRVEDLAQACGTLAYEIFVRIGPRVPRLYPS